MTVMTGMIAVNAFTETEQPMPKPLHAQLAADLRQEISDGKLEPGRSLPSESVLGESHQVSRITVRKALQTLEQEGLIVVTPGRGRVVRDQKVYEWHLFDYEQKHQTHPELDGWASDVVDQGGKPYEKVVAVEVVDPPQDVRDKLGLADGTLALLRKRVRSIDGKPAQLSSSYFPYDLVEGTIFMRPGSQSAPGGLLASIGHPQKRKRHEITSRNASPEEAEELDLTQGTPVIRHLVTGYDKDSKPVRCMVTLAASDVARMVIEEDGLS